MVMSEGGRGVQVSAGFKESIDWPLPRLLEQGSLMLPMRRLVPEARADQAFPVVTAE